MPLSTGTRLGPYEVLGPLGAGGMGEVYRARDTRLNRNVALKVLPDVFTQDPDRLHRFEREAQVLASLNHPNIAALYGLEESGGVRALVMELVEGPTLAERIQSGPIPLDEAVPIAKQIAEALEYAHDRAVIHRDLKPANVKVTGDPAAVKVLDFGLAKALDDRPASNDSANSPTISMGATRMGVILGTAGYMSPEQAKGRPADRRADIWSFGVVLCEMLTGRPLYSGETAAETLASVMKDEVAIPESPPAVRSLLRRCLEKDPRRRLQAIGEARIALEDPLAASPTLPPPAAPRRPIAWIALAALSLLTSLALAVIHFRETPTAPRVLRAVIIPPEKSVVQSFALSPDGSSLAAAIAIGGKQQLWLRALDASQFRPLPGTEDAQYPFWSPDSRYIGFFAQRKLKKIPAGGGPPQTLCDVGYARGGTWNRDGVILFGQSGGPLQQVSSAGGVATTVATSEGGRAYRYPVFLPDGRHFLYTLPAGDQSTGVYLAALDSPAARRILADPSGAVWVPSSPASQHGHLLFIRDGSLMAQPFDPSTLQLAGEAFPIATQASFGPDNAYPLVSASADGLLVYLAGRNAADRQLTWFDRSGKELSNVGSRGHFRGVALSPDEKTVAADHVSVGIASDLWLHEWTRGVESRFTTHQTSVNGVPVWSPDGRRIAFASNRTGRFDLYVKNAGEAGQDQILLQNGNRKTPSDWSRDGQYLLYTETDAKTQSDDLWVMPMEGDPKPVPFLHTEFNETEGQFSPDGHWIAYASDESGRFEIYVRPFPAGPGRRKVSVNGGAYPRWRSDGKELFYLTTEGKVIATAVKVGLRNEFESAGPQELFDAHVGYMRPGEAPLYNYYSVTHDGQRFLVTAAAAEVAGTPLTLVLNWQNAK